MTTEFRPPTSAGILGRKPTITAEFVRSPIPVIPPTEGEYAHALDILGQQASRLECSYCGGTYSEWDHLRPVVMRRKPTGYILNIQNLVPSCGKCSQSKGNKHWRDWMFSAAPLSLKTRQIEDLDTKAERLTEFEAWGGGDRLNLSAIHGEDEFGNHWHHLDRVVELMEASHSHAEGLKVKIAEELTSRSTTNPTALETGEVDFRTDFGRTTESALGRSDWVC